MTSRKVPPPLETVLGSAAPLRSTRLEGDGPEGRLPVYDTNRIVAALERGTAAEAGEATVR